MLSYIESVLYKHYLMSCLILKKELTVLSILLSHFLLIKSGICIVNILVFQNLCSLFFPQFHPYLYNRTQRRVWIQLQVLLKPKKLTTLSYLFDLVMSRPWLPQSETACRLHTGKVICLAPGQEATMNVLSGRTRITIDDHSLGGAHVSTVSRYSEVNTLTFMPPQKRKGKSVNSRRRIVPHQKRHFCFQFCDRGITKIFTTIRQNLGKLYVEYDTHLLKYVSK